MEPPIAPPIFVFPTVFRYDFALAPKCYSRQQVLDCRYTTRLLYKHNGREILDAGREPGMNSIPSNVPLSLSQSLLPLTMNVRVLLRHSDTGAALPVTKPDPSRLRMSKLSLDIRILASLSRSLSLLPLAFECRGPLTTFGYWLRSPGHKT
jgi:hypothetical protein